MGPIGTHHDVGTDTDRRTLEVQFDYDVVSGTPLRVLRSLQCERYVAYGAGKKLSCGTCDGLREAVRKRGNRQTPPVRAADDSDDVGCGSTIITTPTGQNVTIPPHVMNNNIPTSSLSSVRCQCLVQ
jgi:hypothetical protein